MEKTILTIVSLLFFTLSQGQIEDLVTKALATKDFKEFLSFAAMIRLEKNVARIRCEYVRDVTPGFQEAVFYLERNTSVAGTNIMDADLRINIIKTGNTIIYYYFENKKTEVTANPPVTLYGHPNKFCNESRYRMFEEAFYRIYDTTPSIRDLFIDSIYFGNRCGHRGTPTDQDSMVMHWVKTKDKTQLVQWLQSANTEKQLYALKGLLLLCSGGIGWSAREKQMIDAVRAKKGNMLICFRCGAGNPEIGDVLKNFRNYVITEKNNAY